MQKHTQPVCREAHCIPCQRKRRANLPEKIIFHSRVIPHVPTKLAVDYAANRKLNQRDGDASDKTSECKAPDFNTGIEDVENQKSRSARNGHRPVRMPSVYYFHKAVKYSPQPCHNGIFLNQNNHPSYV